MSFTNPPVWSNQGTEPPEELKTNGFSAGYKPPASYFNWFWNRVSTCIAELQDAAGEGSGSVEMKAVTISAAGWELDSASGFYRYDIVDETITENCSVDICLDLASLTIAENCTMKSVTEAHEGGVYIYAEDSPTTSMHGTMIVQKGAE